MLYPPNEAQNASKVDGYKSIYAIIWPDKCAQLCQLDYGVWNSVINSTKHGLRKSREEIAFTARPKIKSQSQIFRYGQSIFCLPHRPKISDFFDLRFHWVSVVRGYAGCILINFEEKFPTACLFSWNRKEISPSTFIKSTISTLHLYLVH